jgi:hypothetical protein
MFKLNYRVWYAWTYTTRALELPVVVKIKYDLNKISSKFKANCRVWCAWTYPTHAPELLKVRFWTARIVQLNCLE